MSKIYAIASYTKHVTDSAAVLFGDRERLDVGLPICLLRLARFRGSDKTRFLDNPQYYGNALTLLANAQCVLHDFLPIAARFVDDRFDRIDKPFLPTLVTCVALANALCHRVYFIGSGTISVAIFDDRLECMQFSLTPEKLFFPHESRP